MNLEKIAKLAEKSGVVKVYNNIYGHGQVELLAVNPTMAELAALGIIVDAEPNYLEQKEVFFPLAYYGEDGLSLEIIKNIKKKDGEPVSNKKGIPLNMGKITLVFQTVSELDSYDEAGKPTKKKEIIMVPFTWYQNSIAYKCNPEYMKTSMSFINGEGRRLFASLTMETADQIIPYGQLEAEVKGNKKSGYINNATWPMPSETGYNSNSLPELASCYRALYRFGAETISNGTIVGDIEDLFYTKDSMEILDKGTAEEITEWAKSQFAYVCDPEGKTAYVAAIDKSRGADYSKDWGSMNMTVAVNYKDGPDILYSNFQGAESAYKGALKIEEASYLVKLVTRLNTPSAEGKVFGDESKNLYFGQKMVAGKITAAYGFKVVDPKNRGAFVPNVKTPNTGTSNIPSASPSSYGALPQSNGAVNPSEWED